MKQTNVPSINIARILREGGSTEARGEIEGSIDLENTRIPLAGKALWKAAIIGVGGEGEGNDFWLSGEIAGNAVMECRRCLTPTPTPVRAHFQHLLRYQPGLNHLELIEEDEEEIFVFGSPELDLSPFLSEAFALEMPITTLCREDCKGLCPVCGANRNEVDCGHGDQGPKTKLAQLLDELN